MKAAVFFPGIGYHCDKPLLYYSRKLAQECGYEETIALSYTYDGGNIRGNEEKMQQAFESLYEQAEKSLSAIDFDKYDEILFVAKSVGTIIASAYAEKHSIRCRQILYTPLKYTYNFAHREAIAFIGTSDPWSIVSEIQALSKKQQVPMYIYENANHSLETTDTLENLEDLVILLSMPPQNSPGCYGGKPRDFCIGNKKKHIIILSRCVQRSVKKLFLDTSFCSMLYSITQTVLCESGFHNVSLKVVILI